MIYYYIIILYYIVYKTRYDIFSSLEKGKGADTHTPFARTRRSLPGEGHHQPRQHHVSKLPGALSELKIVPAGWSTGCGRLLLERRVWAGL